MFTDHILQKYDMGPWFTSDDDDEFINHLFTTESCSHILADWIVFYGLDGHKKLKNYVCTQNKHYYYMLTFTIKKGTDPQKSSKAYEYVIRQHLRSGLQMVKYAVVEELTQSGTKHWHCAVKAKLPIKKNRFQQYKVNHGHMDISRNKTDSWTTIMTYMSKENDPIILL